MELTFLSYLDLTIQIILGLILLLDYFFLKKRSLKLHGTLMLTVFLVNTVLILVIMIPPFLGESIEIFENLAEIESLLFLSHHIIGLLAELLAGFIVVKYIIRAFNSSFCKNKNLMRATLIIWLISIILGIILFLWHVNG